ncbi:hypothetical protein BKA70DRAFT_1355699 [Coprinopsis sp. MPI-PUGE-AT-0042]|nr:hypothetical protein BKA70DRAFT_1355699 [Coprinopsis sp. MPI-PUGE-AT-0042]
MHRCKPRVQVAGYHPASTLPASTASLFPTHMISPSMAKQESDPSLIILLFTSRPDPFSALLLSKYGINTRPITWPTVPKGKGTVRICLHVGTRGRI